MPEFGGVKWGPSKAFGTSGGVVTWSIVGGGRPGLSDAFKIGAGGGSHTVRAETVLPFSPEAALRQAFANWSRHADITFVQVKDSGDAVGRGWSADIRIAFGHIDGGGNGTLGLAYFPGGSSFAGDILFDSADRAFFANRNNFVSVATHEIGHAIGLAHTEAVTALMNPRIGAARTLQPDDIAGVKAIYGPGGGTNKILSLPGGRSDLEIIQDVPGLRIEGTHDRNKIMGGDVAEVINGREGDDRLEGRGGQDRLLGGKGGDTLKGGADADKLWGQAEDDRIFGGARADTLFGGAGGDLIHGDGGADRIVGGGGSDSVLAGQGFDTIFGGSGGDRLHGGDHSDRIFGEIGRDFIDGGKAEDRLFAGAGDDTLRGDAGDDVLNGGAGDDRMIGGSGGDRFVFLKNAGADRIEDFQPGVDKIDFTNHQTITNFADLSLVAGTAGVIIASGTSEITLRGLQPSDLTEGDFLF